MHAPVNKGSNTYPSDHRCLVQNKEANRVIFRVNISHWGMSFANRFFFEGRGKEGRREGGKEGRREYTYALVQGDEEKDVGVEPTRLDHCGCVIC